MQLPRPRGPISAAVRERLATPHHHRPALSATTGHAVERALVDVVDPITDDDLQLSLCMLYELHYQGFDDVDDALEWAPSLLAVRRQLEHRLESALRTLCPAPSEPPDESVVEALSDLTATDRRPEMSSYLSREGNRQQFEDFLIVRSLQQLKEADAQTWLIPRLTGRAKAALIEIQIDEYGSGRSGRLHSELYAVAMRACGLDSAYGAYLDQIPGHSLAVGNTMTMLGLHRRLRGAAAGYFAAFEATSSIPSQGYADAVTRLRLAADAAIYFSEHVEADAVHEQLAIRNLCGGLVDAEPALADDVLWGARLCMALEDVAADRYLTAWQAGESCLLADPATGRADLAMATDRIDLQGGRHASPSVA